MLLLYLISSSLLAIAGTLSNSYRSKDQFKCVFVKHYVIERMSVVSIPPAISVTNVARDGNTSGLRSPLSLLRLYQMQQMNLTRHENFFPTVAVCGATIYPLPVVTLGQFRSSFSWQALYRTRRNKIDYDVVPWGPLISTIVPKRTMKVRRLYCIIWQRVL
jgi:hypothetical protein